MDLGTRLKDRMLSLIKSTFSMRWTILERLLVFVLLVFVILGFVSLPLSVAWQTENAENRSEPIPLNDGRTLTVDYPAMVVAEDKPAQLLFSLSSDSLQSFTQPLTITATLPQELLRVTSLQSYRDPSPVLTFQPLALSVQTQTLQIANARLDVLSQQRTISLESLEIPNGKSAALPIEIEGTLQGTLRGFFGNSLNLLITGFLSAAVLLYDLFQKQREAEERREAERRKEANETRDRFGELMSQQNTSRARDTLDDLKQRSLAEYLKSDDLKLMGRIIDWADGKLEGLDIKTLPQGWLDAVAGALIFAFYDGHSTDQELRSALRELPVDKLSDDVRNAVQTAVQFPEQARHWPIPPDQPKWELVTLNEQWKGRLEINPFPFECAEDDFQFLFSREVDAFWGEHPLYTRIATTKKTEIIAGATGTGKTAMALALGEYLHNSETLACYLPGLPDEREIQRALARKILDFVCWHPTFLRKLGQDSRTLLVRVCTDALGNQAVLAALDSAPIEKMEYITQVQEDRKKRENIVRSQLRLLREAVVSLPARGNSVHDEWSNVFATCAQFLSFRLPIRIVIDANGERCTQWINDLILPYTASWRRAGIIAKIFVPSRTTDTIKFPEDHSGWLSFSQLEWDVSLLAQMLDHRFQSIMAAKESRVVRPDVVDNDLWNQMIEKAKNNPRCFIRLWNRMLALASTGVLDETVLAKALEGFECP